MGEFHIFKLAEDRRCGFPKPESSLIFNKVSVRESQVGRRDERSFCAWVSFPSFAGGHQISVPPSGGEQLPFPGWSSPVSSISQCEKGHPVLAQSRSPGTHPLGLTVLPDPLGR